MPKLPWASVAPVFTFLSGGLAGAVFTWYMNHPVPTTLTYGVTTTTAGTDTTVKGLIPNLKMQIGNEEIPVVHTHAIEFVTQSGPQLEQAEIAITFSPGLRVFGMAADAPSPLHTITCSQIPNGVRCIMSPLTLGNLNKYRVTVATNQREPSGIITATNKMELQNADKLVEERCPFMGWTAGI